MWYNVDFNRWIEQLVPPILRSKVLLAILKAMIIPIIYIHEEFLKKKIDVERRLDTTAQRTSIESYLNGLFFLKNREIRIEEIDNSNKVYVYFAEENQIAPFINNKFILYELGEVPDKPNFIVHIPTFLCTLLEIEKDKYKGEFLTKIVNALNVYKPAGKRYSINLYEV